MQRPIHAHLLIFFSQLQEIIHWGANSKHLEYTVRSTANEKNIQFLNNASFIKISIK